jgi:HEAT repeat protein
MPEIEPKEELEQEIEEIDEEEFGAVEKLIQFFIKTVKSLVLYPEENPIPKEFKRDLYDRFAQFLEKYDQLNLKTKETQLIYKGKMVYRDGGKDERLAHLLHRDGIREVTFFKGLEQRELSDFLEGMRLVSKTGELEDDLVTILWEKDLTNINYVVVEDWGEQGPGYQEDLSVTLVTQVIPQYKKGSTDFDFQQIYSSELASPGPVTDEKTEQVISNWEKHTTQGISGITFLQKSADLSKLLVNLDRFSAEEVGEINKILEMDRTYVPFDALLLVLYETLYWEEEQSAFVEILREVEKMLHTYLSKADFSCASRMVIFLRDLEQEFKGICSFKADGLKEALDRAGDKERIRYIINALNDRKDMDFSAIEHYLTLLNSNVVSSMIEMLRHLRFFPARKMVCEVMSRMGKDHVQMVGEGAYDPQWYVVRNIAVVLGKIGKPECVEFLKTAIVHTDARVRREAVRSLIGINSQEAGEVLLLPLNDSDSIIRSIGIRALSQRGDTSAVKLLIQMAQDKKFRERSSEERKLILDALAHLGRDRSIHTLVGLINKKSWFDRGRNNETRLFALRALGLINTLASYQALDELSRKGDRLIRQTSSAILKKKEHKNF